jgi:hypothetical protein
LKSCYQLILDVRTYAHRIIVQIIHLLFICAQGIKRYRKPTNSEADTTSSDQKP